MKLRREIYYFCKRGKQPNMGKIRACCSKGCPHLGERPKRNAETKKGRHRARSDLPAGEGEDARGKA